MEKIKMRYDEIVRGQGFESCRLPGLLSGKFSEFLPQMEGTRLGWWVLKGLIDLDWRFGH
jgi:hypothetical protein